MGTSTPTSLFSDWVAMGSGLFCPERCTSSLLAAASPDSMREMATSPARIEAITLVVRCGGAVFLLELLGSGGVAKGEAAAASSSLSVVFECVDREGEYASLQQSGPEGRFFRPCVSYLVAKGSISGLLSHALTHGKAREAQMLIKMWHATSAPESEKRAWARAKNTDAASAQTDIVRFTAERLGIDPVSGGNKPVAGGVVTTAPHLGSVHLDLDALKERLRSMRG